MNFTETDGDNWYDKNKNVVNRTNLVDKIMIENIKRYVDDETSIDILEIGCSDGSRLDQLNGRVNANLFGIDISSRAIDEGKCKFKDISLTCNNFLDESYEGQKFDVVICGFFLYYILKEDLSRIVFKIDSILKDNGHLIVTDFFSKGYMEKKCTHRENLFMHKMDHSKLFLAYPNYAHISRHTIADDVKSFDIKDLDGRLTVDVLQKI